MAKFKTDPADKIVNELLETHGGAEPIIELLDDIDATEYSIGYSVPDNQLLLRFHNDCGVLSNFTTDASGAYELAHRILKAYDKLEGI